MFKINNNAGKPTVERSRVLCMVVILSIAISGLLPGQQALAADPGDAGALFLRTGMGARAAAMGEGFTAVAEDASSVFWNPAAMAAVLNTNLMFSHSESFLSSRLEQIALTHETDYGTIGLMFTGQYMDKMERREDEPSAIPRGEFSVYDIAFSAGFARYIMPNLSVGATAKPVYQRIDEQSALGIAFDIGIYHISRIEGLRLAAVVLNLGPPMTFIEEEFALPRSVKIGGSYERAVDPIRGQVLFTFDGVFVNDGDPKQHLGAEYVYRRTLALRAGYKGGYDSYGGTFGAGIRYKKLDVDYAFLLVKNDLGDSHRISLSYRP
jgi:hypothetical protein